MTIDEAIETLENDQRRNYTLRGDAIYKAHQLSIEALKREEKRRRFAIPDRVDLLPGETKD